MDKQEFKDFATIEGNAVRFLMPVDIDDLINNTNGVEELNSMVEDFVDDGILLEDMNYSTEYVENNTIFILVEADGTEFLKESE